MAARNTEMIFKDCLRESVVIFCTSSCNSTREVRYELAVAREGIPGVRKSTVVHLDRIRGGRALRKYLVETTNVKSGPIVFIDGKLVGSADEVKRLYRAGELRGMIAEAVRKSRLRRGHSSSVQYDSQLPIVSQDA
uniref:Glutaredoxin domain-containing protein n=1 Tax=Rhodosorus marinus TaxID=101924 RepID=A0A7S2ZW33_9RHOD|mmetsp:Transcript_34723/g.136898  ORF Transcript_34723/g.136898 Transcript_34723/m.136898 type:complete len:136 (+) Transcript_34723:184-591(+)